MIHMSMLNQLTVEGAQIFSQTKEIEETKQSKGTYLSFFLYRNPYVREGQKSRVGVWGQPLD